MSTFCNYGGILTEIQQSPKEVEYMVDYIKQHMQPHGKLVEWGSGGSTCKWLETLTVNQKLFSIEHNADWYFRVTEAIKNHFGGMPANFTYLLSVERWFNRRAPHPEEELAVGLETYVVPYGLDVWDSDIYFVDGIARMPIVMMILHKNTNPSATIFVHDYVGREQWYGWCAQLFDVEIVGTTLAKFTLKK